jgi:hypothetical protein
LVELSIIEMPTPLSVLYSVVEDARRYDDYLEKAANQRLYGQAN